jgi:hypothetical protein
MSAIPTTTYGWNVTVLMNDNTQQVFKYKGPHQANAKYKAELRVGVNRILHMKPLTKEEFVA